jgi:class 3 adenylate cyclase
VNDKNWGAQPISLLEWDQLKNILQTQKGKILSNRNEYFICYVDCKKYLQSKQIGKAIFCANAFYKKFKGAENDEQLINIYNLFITIYEESNMLDDALKYSRLLYALNCKNKSLYDRMYLSNSMVWKLFVYGRNKNSQALIREAQALGEERFTYFEKYPSAMSGIDDDYKINIMALLRLKEWSKAIKISKRALKNYGLDASSKDDIYLNYIRKLYCYMANSYAQLNNRDSAFYYMDQPLMFQIKPTDRNVYIAEKKAYLDGDELMEFIRVLSVLKENKKAAALAYRAAYSPYQFKRKDFREFVKSKYSRIFYTAGMYKEAAEGYKLFSEITDSTKQEEINTLIEKQTTHNRIELANINEINNKKEEISKKQLERQILVRNLFIAGFSLFLIFSIVILFQRNKIKKGKLLSDELLLNILPYTIAEELKLKGNAESKLIDMVTVLFTDFKGFTQLSEQFTPQELVAEINECFSAFDKIMIKYNVEKIKTIGDAYMAAGGLPTSNQTHAEDVICAALEIQQYMSDYKKARQEAGKLFFEIRIGIHSGPVVAGIVGIKKFAYDIWGDTVNIASRMESSGEVGKVNVSETTYELTRENFNFEYRGKIAAKGKGEISMFFVENKS